jgi:hypothetical protein
MFAEGLRMLGGRLTRRRRCLLVSKPPSAAAVASLGDIDVAASDGRRVRGWDGAARRSRSTRRLTRGAFAAAGVEAPMFDVTFAAMAACWAVIGGSLGHERCRC